MEACNAAQPEVSDPVSRGVERREESQELYEAIKKLPVKQRTAVILYYFEEMGIKEIATISGCLEGTVKSRLYGARERLRQELSGAYLTEGRVSL